MNKVIAQGLMIIALPTFVFIAGGWLMDQISGRDMPEKARPPIGRRFGYDADEVKIHWGLFSTQGLKAERKFLELDLCFPLCYGVALAFSLVLAWTALGRPFNLFWLAVPVALMVLVDFTENTAQLHEINRLIANKEAILSTGWIQVASLATTFKWVFVGGVSLGLWVLVGMMIGRSLK